MFIDLEKTYDDKSLINVLWWTLKKKGEFLKVIQNM